MSILIKNVVQNSGTPNVLATPSLGAASIGDLVVVMIGSGVAGGAGTTVADNAGNTYTRIAGRNAGVGQGGTAMYSSILTVANAALVVTVDENGAGSSGPLSIVAWIVSGVSAYNADQANSANFSGSSTAWSVGPTSLTPPAGSIFFFALSASATETGVATPTGYNTVGSNGFTSGMAAAAAQTVFGASDVTIVTGYKIASAAETPATTLPAAADWFGVVASFSPTGAPATSYTISGPSTGVVNVASTNFTVTPNGDATGVVVTPASSGAGSFTPASVTFSGSSPATFTYTPTSTVGSPHTISTTNGGGLTNPASLAYTVTSLADPGYYYRTSVLGQ